MPRIRCHYIACVYLDDGYCGAARVELDPDVGCMTHKRSDDPEVADDWEENEDAELEEWDEFDDLWDDEDDF